MSTDQPYSLRFTRHAVRDLDAMFTYITYELDAAEPAKALMREIEHTLSNLREFLYSAPQARDDLLARKGYRALTIRKKYVAVYRVSEAQREVVVQRFFMGGGSTERHYSASSARAETCPLFVRESHRKL